MEDSTDDLKKEDLNDLKKEDLNASRFVPHVQQPVIGESQTSYQQPSYYQPYKAEAQVTMKTTSSMQSNAK